MRMDDHADSRPPIPEIRCIGVIGAGQMGTGIAEVAALADVEVRLLDVSRERLDQAMERIDGHLLRRMDKGTLTDTERQAALARRNPPAVDCVLAPHDDRLAMQCHCRAHVPGDPV